MANATRDFVEEEVADGDEVDEEAGGDEEEIEGATETELFLCEEELVEDDEGKHELDEGRENAVGKEDDLVDFAAAVDDETGEEGLETVDAEDGEVVPESRVTLAFAEDVGEDVLLGFEVEDVVDDDEEDDQEVAEEVGRGGEVGVEEDDARLVVAEVVAVAVVAGQTEGQVAEGEEEVVETQHGGDVADLGQRDLAVDVDGGETGKVAEDDQGSRKKEAEVLVRKPRWSSSGSRGPFCGG